MVDRKVGDLFTTIVPKGSNTWGSIVEIREGKKVLGKGEILWILGVGGALMKVIVEIVKWVGK